MSEEIQELESAHDFFAVLSMWHTQQVATLEHMMEIPEGTDITVEGKDAHTLKLEGDALRGFKFGIITALNLLGELPFAPVVDEDESEQPSDDQQD